MSLPALPVTADIRSITERVNVLIRLYNGGANGQILRRDGGNPEWGGLPTLTGALGANVALNNTANYFDGPSVAQGSAGTWLVTGNVTFIDSASAANFLVKLWDGATVLAGAQVTTPGASFVGAVSLAGIITNPVGNLRISVRDATSANGALLFNQSGAARDCSLTAGRIG